MRPRLFTVASLVSLVIGLVLVLLCWVSEAGVLNPGGFGRASLLVYDGFIELAVPEQPIPDIRQGPQLKAKEVTFDLWGLHLSLLTYTSGSRVVDRYGGITIAFAYPLAVSAVMPGAWFVAALRKKWRSAKHFCTACGYDLTGNTSGVCPECGNPISPAVPTRRRDG